MAKALRDGLFTFTSESTIADLIMVGKTLEATGKSPKLRFVRTIGDEIGAVTIDADPVRFELTVNGRNVLEEMAVAGHDDGDPNLEPTFDSDGERTDYQVLPDPAAARDNDPRWSCVTDETHVYWEGNWTTWGELAGNERTECAFNIDGVLVGGYPI